MFELTSIYLTNSYGSIAKMFSLNLWKVIELEDTKQQKIIKLIITKEQCIRSHMRQ